ncbi:MAG TPA: efflux RND transporter periplasmic adaptor subunit [Terriglobia bacterium]|nr:efflux RND transporter periplasmic adaptor subunit [Terriglobia bacterium]
MRFPRFALLAFLIALVSTGCGTSPGTAAGISAGDDGTPDANQRRVHTVTAVEKPIEQLVVVTGTLAAEQEIVLGLKVAGRIAELPVDLGSVVKKGDVIARVDTTDFALRVRQSEAAVQQARVRLGLSPNGTNEDVDLEQTAFVREARAQMDSTKARLDRIAQLAEKGLISKADLDAVSGTYKVAEAQYADALDEGRNRQGVLAQRRSELEIARQQFDDAVLYAPIAGSIRQRHANVGQYLAAGTAVVTLVQMSPLRLRTEVPERDAQNIRIGMMVRVAVEGAAGTHQGRVVRLSPAIDEANRTLLVETEVANASHSLRPGTFARAEIVASSSQRALMVPAAAVVTFAGIDRVFIVQDGQAVEKRVRTGRHNDAGVEILEGVSAGDKVVIEPGNLTDGEKVTDASEQ